MTTSIKCFLFIKINEIKLNSILSKLNLNVACLNILQNCYYKSGTDVVEFSERKICSKIHNFVTVKEVYSINVNLKA